MKKLTIEKYYNNGHLIDLELLVDGKYIIAYGDGDGWCETYPQTKDAIKNMVRIAMALGEALGCEVEITKQI